ncbi:MAG: biopolymer transporter ExbB [Blastopirellula sp.]|nr:biopolymer transporter ExbB [Blastopirellula sp.]
MDVIFTIVGNSVYFVLAIMALFGLWSGLVVWRRVGALRFRNEAAQDAFLDSIEQPLVNGQFDAAAQLCEGDNRVMPRLASLAIVNRKIGFAKTKKLVADRFQRDVMSDLEFRMSWVNTVVKSAPMVGLLGTVIGMMGAFAQLSSSANVAPQELAGNIMVALITTASGLAIAIPLIIVMAMVNIRIRKMEELVGAGLVRFMDAFRTAISPQGR